MGLYWNVDKLSKNQRCGPSAQVHSSKVVSEDMEKLVKSEEKINCYSSLQNQTSKEMYF